MIPNTFYNAALRRFTTRGPNKKYAHVQKKFLSTRIFFGTSTSASVVCSDHETLAYYIIISDLAEFF
jgi:hypothetical protein